ncbi:MAG: hypothetical protein M3P49_00925 [Actinomycetota bacterium]|nr:hypothetical protein [Actinomycetota bacterium]
MGLATGPTPRVVREERGVALPAVLGVILLLSLAGAAGIRFATQGVDEVKALEAAQTAQEMAENGLEGAGRPNPRARWARKSG